jgi:drug/metabolite transporter (DMT)-like permease
MIAVWLALIACFGYGTSGFLSGIKSRDIPVLTLLLFTSIAGLIIFLVVLCVRGMPLPRDPNLLYAVLGGIFGVGGLYCFYRGLAVGAISIVVPVSALCVTLPVIVSLAYGEILSALQWFGIILAFSGGILVSFERNISDNTKRLAAGILPALGAALGFGAFFVVMDLAGTVDPLWAVVVSKLSYFLFLLPAIFLKRPSLKVNLIHMPAVVAIGLLDGIAALAYTTATTLGMLSLVAVISSLYPAVSLILAAIILKERLVGHQLIGVVLAISGITLISAG